MPGWLNQMRSGVAQGRISPRRSRIILPAERRQGLSSSLERYLSFRERTRASRQNNKMASGPASASFAGDGGDSGPMIQLFGNFPAPAEAAGAQAQLSASSSGKQRATEVDMNPVDEALDRNEKPTTVDFKAFLAQSFMGPGRKPDRAKTTEPIHFWTRDKDSHQRMWSLVKRIPGLVLLRKHASDFVIGWDTAMHQDTIELFERLEPLTFYKHNLDTARLNAEPELFLESHLGFDYQNPRRTPHGSHLHKMIAINLCNLFDTSIVGDLETHRDIVMRQCENLVFIGWGAISGSRIQKMKAAYRGEEEDAAIEARHREWYLTEQNRPNK